MKCPKTVEHRAKCGRHVRTPETRAKISAAKTTPEARAKMSALLRDRVVTPETRVKLRKAAMGNQHSLGHKHTPEARAKMSVAQKGRVVAPETRAKLSKIATGRKHTPKTRVKISTNMMGKQNALGHKHTPEWRAKMSALHKGHEVTPETRAKLKVAAMSNQHSLGHMHSEEQRNNISAGRAKAWDVAMPDERDRLNRTSKVEYDARIELDFLCVRFEIARFGFSTGRSAYPDLYFPQWDLIIEIDGSYYHDAEADAERDALLLREHGLTVIRIPEAEVRADPQAALAQALAPYLT